MLKIQRATKIKRLGSDKLIYYPFELKINRKRFDLSEKWSELQFEPPKRLIAKFDGNYHPIPNVISQNLFYYLDLNKVYQDKCLYFSKYLINSNVYDTRVYHHLYPLEPFQIIKFYQIIANKYFFVHAGITLHNNLILSKLGFNGLYICNVLDLAKFYETDLRYYKLCSSNFLLTPKDEFFKRNIQIRNTFDTNEE